MVENHILHVRSKIQLKDEATVKGHGECICGHRVELTMVPLEIEGKWYVPVLDCTVLTEMFQHGRN